MYSMRSRPPESLLDSSRDRHKKTAQPKVSSNLPKLCVGGFSRIRYRGHTYLPKHEQRGRMIHEATQIYCLTAAQLAAGCWQLWELKWLAGVGGHQLHWQANLTAVQCFRAVWIGASLSVGGSIDSPSTSGLELSRFRLCRLNLRKRGVSMGEGKK